MIIKDTQNVNNDCGVNGIPISESNPYNIFNLDEDEFFDDASLVRLSNFFGKSVFYLPEIDELDEHGIDFDEKPLQAWGFYHNNCEDSIKQEEEAITRLSKENCKIKNFPNGLSEEDYNDAMDFLKDPNKIKRIINDYEQLGYVGEDFNIPVAYLAATSRKLEKPISLLVTGPSSAGKSMLVNTTLKLIPGNEKIELDRLTQTALYNYRNTVNNQDFTLSHKILRINEVEGAKKATYPIRALLSEGKLTSSISIKSKGIYKTEEFTVNGPIVLFETTTGTINPENHTRVFEVVVDETKEQTRRVHEITAKRWSSNPQAVSQNNEKIIRRHHNAQALLKSYKVIIPYAEHINFPDNHVRSRRDYERYLLLVVTVALLRQYEKNIPPDAEYISADLVDYEIAYNLGVKLLTNIYDPLKGQRSRDLLNTLIELVMRKSTSENKEPKSVKFTRAEIMNFDRGWNQTEIQRHIHHLEDSGYLHVHEGGQGKTYIYSLTCLDRAGNYVPKELTTPEELEQAIKIN
ncbi:DNA primase [Desulfocucumis palustris]|uniref:DNA primase n=1 Tax=Desulfocucumis palustris TaxID=1898651 RepID=A0A2L2XA98_9FIRM|nr:hypothetical protein [Desulfocucumis palustris]GBF32884.1 DNA primase [Desulfocucumis palustris]